MTATDPATRTDLGTKAANAVLWNYASFASGKVLVLVTLAILARLLTPAEFGIVGFATLAIAYLAVLKDLGLGGALIQRQDDTEEAAQTVYSLNLILGALLTAGIALWWWGEAVDLMYLPPVLINIALMVLFGRTLLPGATPLVARIASLWRGPLDSAVALYTRQVTIAWTIFSGLMVFEAIILALFAPLHIWSLFTNFLNYVFVLLFFIIEYRLRLYCLPDHEHLSFRGFCRLLASTDFRTLAR